MRILLTELNERQVQIEARLQASSHLQGPNRVEIEVPGLSRVLQVHVIDGSPVTRGQELAQVARCSELHAVAAVRPERYSLLRPGMNARITTRTGVYQGTVVQLLGPLDAIRSTSHFPATLSNGGDDRDRTLLGVRVESSALKAESCDLGAWAEIEFNDQWW